LPFLYLYYNPDFGINQILAAMKKQLLADLLRVTHNKNRQHFAGGV